MNVNLDLVLLPNFKKLFKEIINFVYNRVVIKGGRSSGKSTFICICIIIGTLMHKRSAVCIVRNNTSVEKSLDNVFLKALYILNLRKRFRYVQTKHKFILQNKRGQDTDIEILCSGADDPERLKGIQPKRDTFWCLWIEEATNFDNIKAIDNVESSIGRGDIEHFVTIISYNPRMNTSHFLNLRYENIPSSDNIEKYVKNEETFGSKLVLHTQLDDITIKECIFHCTYKSVFKYGHKEWISAIDRLQIDIGEKSNSDYYRWYYLGEVRGQDNVNVFRNIIDWDGDTSKLTLNKIDRGFDISNGGHDPYAYTEWFYDKRERNLYCLAEAINAGTDPIENVARAIKVINKNNLSFYIDSAVPLTRTLFQKEKLNPIPVKKLHDSVVAGILFLQSCQAIYICKEKTPTTYKEFKEYEYKIDKYDEVTSELPDKNNHTIDSCRYANCQNIMWN